MPVPYSLATSDGWPIKTAKSKLLTCIEPSDCSSEFRSESYHVIDGNAMMHSICKLPRTFGQIAKLLFDMLPKVERVDFVTDTFKTNSIKSLERLRRGTSTKILLNGPEQTVPSDWHAFLSKDENKTQLIEFILSEWSSEKYTDLLKGRRIFYASGSKCFLLEVNEGVLDKIPILSLHSNQEEADTRIILHVLHIAGTEKEIDVNTIIVRSPDTDVLLLLIHFSLDIQTHSIYFDTGTGNKRRLISIKAIVEKIGVQFSKALLGFHAFTGCDTTSAFMRKGKVRPLKLL